MFATAVLLGFALLSAPDFVRAQEPAPEAAAQEAARPLGVARGKKLFLTDGSFQLARDWEVKGDRVRFYSVERSRWEEIPTALVDFEATRKAEQTLAQQQEQMRDDIAESRTAQLAGELDVDASIEVAPGVFLPDDDGLYVLDGRTVVPLTQVGADVRLDKGRLLTQILVPIPIIPGRHKVQVRGKAAVLRLTTPAPEFYIRTADAREPEIELIRAKVKGDKREIEVITTTVVGEEFRDRKTVSVERWSVARGVYRLTMSQSLEPGEYVLAEFLPGEGINLYVWDFGVDGPKKPAP
jgi:hypothetical protein